MTNKGHTPVLLDETIRLLDPQPGQTAVDCTTGAGGHAEAIARLLGPTGTLIINDCDRESLSLAELHLNSLAAAPKIVSFHGNFAELPRKLVEHGLQASAVLADLGFASTQMNDPLRGFSFSRDGPLDMRLDTTDPTTAAELVNTLSEEELVSLLFEYGEEKKARRIAQKLVAAREAEPICTTARFASIVREAAGPRRYSDRIDPATRTFQAVRIAVNDELGSLDRLLDGVRRSAAAHEAPGSWLAPGARVGIISFHSLEDRRVKRCFRELANAGQAELVTRRPVIASDHERASNPRSRSAKLRLLRLQAVDSSR
jgi:16S rRNA (cytosine1402-N4)-methyltransferase